jgi:uncharacterized protein (DUF362 family)
MTQVALTRCAGYDAPTFDVALDRSLELIGGLRQFVRPGDRVLLKPNLVSAQPAVAAATTHPQLISSLASRLLDLGARPVIGDGPAFNTAARVAEVAGIGEVARRLGVPIVEFDGAVVRPSARPSVRSRFALARAVVEADVVINLPKLKAHRQLGFTCGVKSLYGCMPGKRKAYFHMERGNRDSDFAELVAAFAYTVAPALTIADAVVAMERDGPVGGDPRPLGLLAAGADPAAVDTVLAEVIRPPDADNLILNACRRLGLGFPQVDRIDVRGEAIADVAVSDFRHPYLIGVRFSPGRLARSIWRNFLMTRLGQSASR